MASQYHEMWVVYDHPTDFPESYVARKWKNCTPTQDIIVETTLETVRERLPNGLVRLERHELDDPCIVESWI